MCNSLRRNDILGLFITIVSAVCFNSCDKLPDDVNVSDIPDYYFQNHYLDNRVQAINDAIADCTGDCETFFWITDMHWEPDLNTRKSPLLIKYIASKTGIEKVLNGGDTGNSQVICENAISQLRNAIGSNKVYSVTGNHEINDASRYERPFKRVADELRGYNTDIIYGDGDDSYFYFDNIEKRIRYIGLSAYGYFLDDNYESRYNNEQLSWLKNTALKVEEGWTIIIFTHTLYHADASSDKLTMGLSGTNDFVDVLDSYSGNGSISCVLMGHSHKDRIHIGRSGIPYIITACDRHDRYKGDINVERIPGTISEQHFEVAVVDKGKRQIKLFSIGANARDGYDNDPGKEVDVRIVSY